MTAVPGKPDVKISGQFRIGVNTRPLYEDQIVQWKIVKSDVDDMDSTVVLQQGTFLAYREVRIETLCRYYKKRQPME
jgi:hypothetical protein